MGVSNGVAKRSFVGVFGRSWWGGRTSWARNPVAALVLGVVFGGWVSVSCAAPVQQRGLPGAGEQGAGEQGGAAETLPVFLLPEDALVSAAWAGFDLDRPGHPAAGTLLSDVEFRKFYEEVYRSAVILIEDEMTESEGAIFKSLIRAMSVPGIAYLRAEDGAGSITYQAGLVVHQGEAIESLQRLAEQVAGRATNRQEVQVGPYQLQRCELGSPEEVLTFGDMGDWWLVTYGADEPKRLAGLKDAGTSPEWWQRVTGRLDIKRPLGVLSVDWATVLDKSSAELDEREEFEAGLSLLGLRSIERVTTLVGFDDQGYRHQTWLETPEGLGGLLAGIQPGGLGVEELVAAPGDATFAVAMDVEVAEVYQRLAEFARGRDSILGSGLREMSGDFKRLLRTDDLRQVAGAIGSPWTLYHSSQEGGLLSGFALIMPVRDVAVLREVEQVWVEELRREQREARGEWFFERNFFFETEYLGETFYTSFTWGRDVPYLNWCLTDEHLIVTTSATSIKPILERLAEPSAVKPGIQLNDPQASLVGEVNLSQLQGTTLGMAQMFLRVIASEFVNDLGDASQLASALPYGELVATHDTEDRIALSFEDEGVLVDIRVTLPGSELLFVGVAAPMLIEVLDRAGLDPTSILMPLRAQEATSINNLRQLAIACHNYHDTFGGLPPAFSVDDDGEPLLSWRVHLLPYLDQGALYNQFHLDEPWDSEHNIKLVEAMPGVFRSPGSEAGEGKTNYLTIRDEASLFPSGAKDANTARGVQFREVIDGLSNTIMVVEATDKEAVTWTKPDDLKPDMVLLKQLIGLRQGKFLAAYGDGAVRAVPEAVGEKGVRSLITKGGGEEPAQF